MSDTAFVLDLDSNPHPKMRKNAVRLHERRQASPDDAFAWQVYLGCMADATGRPESELLAWVERRP